MATVNLKSFAVFASLMVLGACATTDIKPSAVTNLPPSERFASFSRFEVKRIQLAPTYSSDEASREATGIIQKHLDARLNSTVNEWNETGKNAVNPRMLSIEPRIEQIKYLSSGARVLTGAASGSSAVIMRVRYVDTSSGKVVAEPEFFQRAAAMGGAWSFGGTDQDMLRRIADLVSNYTINNYSSAVGGPTGAPQELVQ